MKVEQLTVVAAELPMAQPFSHAGAQRQQTASVLVFAEAAGYRGWGEGAPRRYVTGETVESACVAIEAISLGELAKVLELGEFSEAIAQLSRLDIDALLGTVEPMPAAAAAVELALFDLICQIHQKSGQQALHSRAGTQRDQRRTSVGTSVSYVVDLSGDPAEKLGRLSRAAVAAIKHVKVKISDDLEDSLARVGRVRELFGSKTAIALDVNGAWNAADAVSAAKRFAPLSIAWIEEPVAPRDWKTMRAIRAETNIPVMLDESFSSAADLVAASEQQAADLVNIRISKCGGLLSSIKLLELAAEHGLKAQLGVHVGEIGPLWAAMRLLAVSQPELVTVEAGKHHEWFPEPLTTPAIAVDRERYVLPNRWGADALGLGLQPSSYLLESLNRPSTTHQREMRGISL